MHISYGNGSKEKPRIPVPHPHRQDLYLNDFSVLGIHKIYNKR